MNQKKGRTLTCPNRSSACIIIIDLSNNKPSSYCESISTALSQFLLLQNCIPGLPRLSYISLYVLGSYTECVVPLQNIKTNFQKIIQHVQELKTFDGILECGKESFEENFSFVLMEVLGQFQQSSSKIPGVPSQLDICLITCQKHGFIEKQAARVLKESNMNLIKKVQIVHVSNSNASNSPDFQSSTESTGSADSGTTEILCGYIESLFVENNELSFDQYFKSWLQDNGSDDIHLLVEFNDENKGFTIKCDLMDTIMNPLYMNNGRNLLLETNLNYTPINPSLKTKQSNMCLYSLKPNMAIKTSSVCESVLYGFPLIVKPTTCWKLDWEELERNQNYFLSVNAYLQKEDIVLLLEQTNQSPVNSYFLLLPSTGGTMLIKSIASRDIMMPRDTNMTVQNHVIDDTVQEILQKIDADNEYNPFNFTCGLFNRVTQLSNNQKTSKKPLSLQKRVNVFNENSSESTQRISFEESIDLPYSTGKPSPYSFGKSTPYSTVEPTPLSTGKQTQLSTREPTPYATGKTTLLSTGKPSPLFNRKATSYSIGKSTPLSTEKPAMLPTGNVTAQPQQRKQAQRYVPRFSNLSKPIPVTNNTCYSQSIVFKNKSNTEAPAQKRKKPLFPSNL